MAGMRTSLIAGLLLIGAGIFLVLRPPHYSSQQSVVKIGGFEANVNEERALPGWVGGVVLGGGVVLLGAALLKRS
jgi:drug/metabolite transporter (DMT)-like permease